VGGTYLEFSEGTRINLNPFTGIRDIAEETPMLKAVLAQMAAPKDGLNSLQMAFLGHQGSLGRARQSRHHLPSGQLPARE